MLDSGVRIAAAFLPVGIPVLVGLVVAVVRRRALPAVSLPAIVGLLLQLVVVLVSTFLVAAASFNGFGLAPASFLTLTSVLGFGVIVLQVVSWTLLLVALFRRLPARSADRTPTGRHALLDEQGEQVIAEEGTTLLPVSPAAAAVAGAGAGAGLGAAAATGSDAPVAPFGEPSAVTETFAAEPAPEGPQETGPDDDLDREEPPALTAESLDEAAQTEDEAHGDVADTPATPETPETPPALGTDPDEPVTTTLTATDEPTADDPVDEDADDAVDEDAVPAADAVPDADPDPETGPDDADPADPADPDSAIPEEDVEDAEDDAVVTDTLPATDDAATSSTATPDPTPTPSAGHPWFDPAGAADAAEEGDAEPTRAGSTEGR